MSINLNIGVQFPDTGQCIVLDMISCGNTVCSFDSKTYKCHVGCLLFYHQTHGYTILQRAVYYVENTFLSQANDPIKYEQMPSLTVICRQSLKTSLAGSPQYTFSICDKWQCVMMPHECIYALVMTVEDLERETGNLALSFGHVTSNASW